MSAISAEGATVFAFGNGKVEEGRPSLLGFIGFRATLIGVKTISHSLLTPSLRDIARMTVEAEPKTDLRLRRPK